MTRIKKTDKTIKNEIDDLKYCVLFGNPTTKE